MDMEKFTERSRGFLQAAQTIAIREENQRVMPEHLLKALMDDEQGFASNLITRAGGDAQAVRNAVDQAVSKLPKVSGGQGQVYIDPSMVRVLDEAEKLAKKAGDSFVPAERVLTALAVVNTHLLRKLSRRWKQSFVQGFRVHHTNFIRSQIFALSVFPIHLDEKMLVVQVFDDGQDVDAQFQTCLMAAVTENNLVLSRAVRQISDLDRLHVTALGCDILLQSFKLRIAERKLMPVRPPTAHDQLGIKEPGRQATVECLQLLFEISHFLDGM
jgi:hypothetical protein